MRRNAAMIGVTSMKSVRMPSTAILPFLNAAVWP